VRGFCPQYRLKPLVYACYENAAAIATSLMGRRTHRDDFGEH